MCFKFESDLANMIAVTPVIKEVSFHWSCLLLALCSVCKNSGYMSLTCKSVKVGTILRGRKALLSAQNQFRFAKIYEKKSAPISCFLAFNGKTWASVISAPPMSSLHGIHFSFGFIDDDKPLSFEHIGKLAKKLDSLIPTVFQPSSECQLPVTSSLQNLEGDIVMKVGSSETTSGETAMVLDSSVSPHMIRLENMLEGLSASVLSLFNGVWVFTSGLESGYLDVGVIVIMDSSLARHVNRVFEMSGQLLSIKLLFKDKILVSILGLYTGASSVVWFFQTGKINSFIVKAANESSFVILSSDFNENSSHKCVSFKRCADLGLVNSLVGSLAIKKPT
ncbi:hypothetical protein G9A89_000093 [Geosiphon pyriformis]|nr:hypothetical protein G9A89_000093 [Geosiphon pyriformis]